jgi:hypothetical protein
MGKEYLQMRRSEIGRERGIEPEVLAVSEALFLAWFPQWPMDGPTGDDYASWQSIAVSDAVVALEALTNLKSVD